MWSGMAADGPPCGHVTIQMSTEPLARVSLTPVDDVVAGRPRRFRVIHGGISSTEHVFRPSAARRAQRDADTGGRDHTVPLEIDRQAKRRLDAVRSRRGIANVGKTFEENGKLVAAQPGHDVAGADRSLELA